MKIIECDFERHGAHMLEIINDAIVNTTWLYDYVPRSQSRLAGYISDRRSKGFPVIVAADEDDTLLGFGTFGEFRHLPGYKYTVEHSVFVDKEVRRRGVGRVLMHELIKLAAEMDMHVMIGAIDSTNKPSVVLHEKLGFSLCGTLREVGYKRDTWLDVLLYQYVFDTPQNPREG